MLAVVYDQMIVLYDNMPVLLNALEHYRSPPSTVRPHLYPSGFCSVQMRSCPTWCRVECSGLKVWMLRVGVLVEGLVIRVNVSGFRIQGLGRRVQGLVFEVQGLECRVQGSGSRV